MGHCTPPGWDGCIARKMPSTVHGYAMEPETTSADSFALPRSNERELSVSPLIGGAPRLGHRWRGAGFMALGGGLGCVLGPIFGMTLLVVVVVVLVLAIAYQNVEPEPPTWVAYLLVWGPWLFALIFGAILGWRWGRRRPLRPLRFGAVAAVAAAILYGGIAVAVVATPEDNSPGATTRIQPGRATHGTVGRGTTSDGVTRVVTLKEIRRNGEAPGFLVHVDGASTRPVRLEARDVGWPSAGPCWRGSRRRPLPLLQGRSPLG